MCDSNLTFRICEQCEFIEYVRHVKISNFIMRTTLETALYKQTNKQKPVNATANCRQILENI